MQIAAPTLKGPRFLSQIRIIVRAFLACLQPLLLFKREARTYIQAGPAQRVMEFELRCLKLEVDSNSLLLARPGRNFWCPDDDDWHEGPDPSEVKSQEDQVVCFA
jgi:hypothetical protein